MVGRRETRPGPPAARERSRPRSGRLRPSLVPATRPPDALRQQGSPEGAGRLASLLAGATQRVLHRGFPFHVSPGAWCRKMGRCPEGASPVGTGPDPEPRGSGVRDPAPAEAACEQASLILVDRDGRYLIANHSALLDLAIGIVGYLHDHDRLKRPHTQELTLTDLDAGVSAVYQALDELQERPKCWPPPAEPTDSTVAVTARRARRRRVALDSTSARLNPRACFQRRSKPTRSSSEQS
jgi:hypothetical protein